jgi:hypothetical protein
MMAEKLQADAIQKGPTIIGDIDSSMLTRRLLDTTADEW